MAPLFCLRQYFNTLYVCNIGAIECNEREGRVNIRTAVLLALTNLRATYRRTSTVITVTLPLLKPKSDGSDVRVALSPRRIHIFTTGRFCASKLRYRALQVTGITTYSISVTLTLCVGAIPCWFRSLVEIGVAKIIPIIIARPWHWLWIF